VKEPVKNLIEGMIKEIMPDFLQPKTYPKASDDAEEKEVQDKFFRISKMEEQQALEFIRRKVLKYVVELFNTQIKHEYRIGKTNPIITIEEVSKRLKKATEDRYDGKRKRDIIQYTSKLIDRYEALFSILKTENGDLSVAYLNPINKSTRHFRVTNSHELRPLYESHIDPISSGEKDKYNITYSNLPSIFLKILTPPTSPKLLVP